MQFHYNLTRNPAAGRLCESTVSGGAPFKNKCAQVMDQPFRWLTVNWFVHWQRDHRLLLLRHFVGARSCSVYKPTQTSRSELTNPFYIWGARGWQGGAVGTKGDATYSRKTRSASPDLVTFLDKQFANS